MTREEFISQMGYSDNSPLKNEDSLDIKTGENGIIDMTNTGTPLMANGKYLPPYSGHHQFQPNSTVTEIPVRKQGGALPKFSHHGEFIRKGLTLTKNIPKSTWNGGRTLQNVGQLDNINFNSGTKLNFEFNPKFTNYLEWNKYMENYIPGVSPPFQGSTVQLRSLMTNNGLMGQTNNHGNISVNAITNYVNNLGSKGNLGFSAVADKGILQTSIDDLTLKHNLTGKSKIPLALFETEVSNNMLKFKPRIVGRYADVGLDYRGLGYPLLQSSKHHVQNRTQYVNQGYDADIMPDRNVLSPEPGWDVPRYVQKFDGIINSGTILWQPDTEANLVLGDPLNVGHFSEEFGPTYGHTRFFVEASQPRLAYQSESQSDPFQKNPDRQIYQALHGKKQWVNGEHVPNENYPGTIKLKEEYEVLINEVNSGNIKPYTVKAGQKHLLGSTETYPVDVTYGQNKILPFETWKKNPFTHRDPANMAMTFSTPEGSPITHKNATDYIEYQIAKGPDINPETGNYMLPGASVNDLTAGYHFDVTVGNYVQKNMTKWFPQLQDNAKRVIIPGDKEYPSVGEIANKVRGDKDIIYETYLENMYGNYIESTGPAGEEIRKLNMRILRGEKNIAGIQAYMDKQDPNVLAQMRALDRNFDTRLFGECTRWAANNNFNQLRFPTQLTEAIIQSYPNLSGEAGNGLNDFLSNPWTEINVAEYDKHVIDFFQGNTYGGHTTVAKKYGPFVYIPPEVNTLYSGDGRSNDHQFLADPANQKVVENFTIPMNKDEIPKNLIGHWKNYHIQNQGDGNSTLTVREEAYTIRNSRWGWNTDVNHIRVPTDQVGTLKGGVYHVKDDGSWEYIGAKGAESTSQYMGALRDQSHQSLTPEAKVFKYENYDKEYHGILKRHSEAEFKKKLYSVFGKDYPYQIVTDSKGNQWYHVDVPEGFKWNHQAQEFRAYMKGGEMKNGTFLPKAQNGVETGVDYSNTEKVTIDGKTYYQYNIQKGDTKSGISNKFGLWNDELILNSINSKYGKSDDYSNYNKNVNRMWAGDNILVGGPEFEPHVTYNNDRNTYINSFSDIPEDQLWSTIIALGHLETGNQVKYTKPKDRKYITGVDIDEFGKAIPGGLYETDNAPFTGTYESGIMNAYGHVSSANALGRFGIKQEHLDKYALDVLGYEKGDDFKKKYLASKTDQQKLMKYLVTDIYPTELSKLRHFYNTSTSQYSDFQLLAALHRGGYPNVEEQLEAGEFSTDAVSGDISIGGYVDKVSRFLNPKVDVSEAPFFMQTQGLHKPYSKIPTYKFGGATGILKPQMTHEVIGDMLDNGAFLPKFKQGVETSIDGIMGKYTIKKDYDSNRMLPYIEYKTPNEELKNNRVYYDKDDLEGVDDFNIIDVYTQDSHQDREHSRIKEIIDKYRRKIKLSDMEMNYMDHLGLLFTSSKVEQVDTKKKGVRRSGADIGLEELNTRKDLFNKSDGNSYGISLSNQIELYDGYINNKAEGHIFSDKIEKIYDRLNSLYYNDAKGSKMTVLDYMKSLNN